MNRKITRPLPIYLSIRKHLLIAIQVIGLSALLSACGGAQSSADEKTSNNSDLAITAPSDSETTESIDTAAQRRFSGLALNLSGFDYWSTDFPTIDQFKRAGGWFTSCKEGEGSCTFTGDEKNRGINEWDTHEQSQLDVDANGWVRSLPAANDANVRYRWISAILFAGDKGSHPAGTYTVLYDGKGQIDFKPTGGSIVQSEPNRVLIDMSNQEGSQLVIEITATDSIDYIRNIRVIPPGGVCSQAKLRVVASAADCAGKGNFISMETLSLTQTWYPNFLADLKGVRALRFMDWARTNESTLENWSDRPLKEDAFWTGSYGVPLGQMTLLANNLQADAWINIPTRATDDYAKNMARFLKNQLHPQAQLTLEYTNEPWNWAFAQTMNWQFEQAKKVFDYPYDDDDNPDNDNDGMYQFALDWHAMRSAQLCDLVKAEFGAEAGRVKCVLNAQSDWIWPTLNYSLPCPMGKKILGKECAESFDAVAIAPYFGAYIDGTVERQKYITDSWFSQGDAYALDRLFEEIRGLNSEDQPVEPPLFKAGLTEDQFKNGALDNARKGMAVYQEHVTNGTYRKPILAYEGGQHLMNHSRSCGDLDADCKKDRDEFVDKWTALFSKANLDPRMGKAYATMMNDWTSTGGQMFTAFNFVSSSGYYGAWGLKEGLFKTTEDSPKWQVMLPYKNRIECWWSGCQE